MRFGIIRIRREGLFDELNRCLMFAALVMQHAEKVQRLRVLRLLREDRAVKTLGVGEFSRAMHFESLLKHRGCRHCFHEVLRLSLPPS